MMSCEGDIDAQCCLLFHDGMPDEIVLRIYDELTQLKDQLALRATCMTANAFYLQMVQIPVPVASKCLSIACERGRIEFSNLLISKGASVDAECRGWTPLQCAVAYGQYKMVRHLVETHGCPVRYGDLEDAVLNDRVIVMKYFIQQDCIAEHICGLYAFACARQKPRIVTLLDQNFPHLSLNGRDIDGGEDMKVFHVM